MITDIRTAEERCSVRRTAELPDFWTAFAGPEPVAVCVDFANAVAHATSWAAKPAAG